MIHMENYFVICMYRMCLLLALPMLCQTEWCPPVCTCYRRLTTTDCSGRHVSIIPVVPNVTTHFYLENNRIEHLMMHAFYTTPQLIVLTLHGNQLTLLDSSTFEGLSKLQELNLSRNLLALLRVTSTLNGTLPALQELDLSGNHLQAIPRNISMFAPNLEVLNLSHNGITSAWLDPSYRSLQSLEKLDLTGNPLHQIASHHFDSLRHGPLQVLRLADCALQFINDSALVGLDNLTSLSVSHNPINATILANAFHGFSNETPLAFLDLSSLTVPRVTVDLLEPFSKLQILDMSNCSIDSVDPEVFLFLPSLHTLELQDNRISDLQNLTILSRLKRLNLRNNQIIDIHISHLPSLEFLDLSFNQMTQIPPKWITQTDGLRIVNLSHNKLKHISPHAFQQVTLNHLDLAFNRLTTLHSFGILKLSMMVISHNRMTTITDDAFTHLEQTLEDLDLSYNAFSHLPDHHFGDFGAIQRLNWANNDLGESLKAGKNSHLFYSFRHLQVLDLAFNNITSLPHAHTQHLHHLTTLNLHGNKVQHLRDISLHDMASLAKLDVSQNLLQSVDTLVLNELQYLETVDLGSNPYHCTCDLVGLVLWINATSVTILGMEDHRQYQCTIASTQLTRYIMSYHPNHKECIDRHHNISQDLTLFGVIVSVVVGVSIITALLVHYGKVCHRLKSLHYRWQIRYREVSGIEGIEVPADPKL